jgi:SAM-dependent methyltransferase
VASDPAGSCRLCGDEQRAFLALDGRFSLVRCASCGLVSTSPPLPEEALAPWYPPEYYGRRNRRFNRLFERLIVVFRERRARLIARRARRGRFLDVGCGRGLLPLLMNRRGWEAHGLEVSETAAGHAREVLGIPVFVGRIEESPWEAGSFEAIVIWHVLEHLLDPRSALRRAHELLASGGLLVIAVPNFESLQARVGSRGWFHLDVPRHYHHFGLGVLRRLLDEEGFDIELVSHFALEQNPYGWVQSLLNRMGFRHNLLYELLKSESARAVPHPARRYPVQTALTLLALVPVVPLSFALFLLELVLRRGGTVEICARRRSRR